MRGLRLGDFYTSASGDDLGDGRWDGHGDGWSGEEDRWWGDEDGDNDGDGVVFDRPHAPGDGG